MATFQAPPWCPPPAMTFLRLMITGALDLPPMTSPFLSPGARDSRAKVKESLTSQNRDGAPRRWIAPA